jgi:TetR/AcrR family transcriptional repressor of nem operon
MRQFDAQRREDDGKSCAAVVMVLRLSCKKRPAMRYSETHKAETRKKVLRAAAAAVRAKGPDGVGVAEIMAEAGLTHGGFYAHFPNKDALVAAAISEAFGQSRRRFDRLTEGMKHDEALAKFIDSYVSPEHRANPQNGCPATTLANDLPRQKPGVRSAFDGGVAELIAQVEAWLPDGDRVTRRALASSLVAEMSGAVALARALSDEETAGRLLADSRANLKRRAGLESGE